MLVVVFFACSKLQAGPPSFQKEIAPILTKCLGCHSTSKAKGELDLSQKKTAFDGGSSGAAIVAGKPDESWLWKRVKADEMPPKTPLSEPEKTLLQRWIEAGAPWDGELQSKKESPAVPLWSLQPIERFNRTPRGATNPIDAFIEEKLKANGLTFSPEADRRTLLRRLKFDLLGLPPTYEEVRAFEADTSPDAYERRVAEYLASPRYGERWARLWLDTVRFAESNGFETNQPRPNAWPYRDWVIESFNADLPYDRFVFQQIAGDAVGVDVATGFLVAGAWDQVKSPDPVLTAQQRADELHDIVSTTSSTFLGLTVGCARCHSHKFDPISHEDYYRLKAIFAGVQHGEREYRTPESESRDRQIAALDSNIRNLEQQQLTLEPLADPGAINPRRLPVNAKLNSERFAPVSARYLRFMIMESSSAEPCIDELEVYTAGEPKRNVALASSGTTAQSAGSYPASEKHKLEHINDGQYGNGRSWISSQVGRGRVHLTFPEVVQIDRVVWGRDRDGQFADRLPTRYRIDVSLDGSNWTVVASSDDRLEGVSKELLAPPGLSFGMRLTWKIAASRIESWKREQSRLKRSNRVYAGTFTTPESTFRLHRGDAMSKREAIPPGTLETLGEPVVLSSIATDQERRIALANWIVDPNNPLTARVIVNRIWQGHFGTGIVDTPSDFGHNGGKPSHPRLMDKLARELMMNNWSLKHIHRLIVTSKTYRQSSVRNDLGQARDAQTRLLWRYPSRRLDAESIRDAILFASGKLDLRMGGPGFDLFEPNGNYVKVYKSRTSFPPETFRRMVYWSKPRMQLDHNFGAFDCPDGGQIAPKRNRSTTPLQSLNLLNSTFVVEQAELLVARVRSESPADPVGRMFELAVQRKPTEEETKVARDLIQKNQLRALARALLNTNEFLHVD